MASLAELSGSPTASAVTRLAARRYPSSSVGENVCASATLSKPWLMVSGGSSAETSTSTSSRSFTARAYSARLSRWKGRQPGFGLTAANSSSRASRACTRPSSAPSGGRFAPAGGIIPARSLRTIFSAVAGDSWASIALKPASDSPPALARSLWQVAQ